MTRIKAVCGCAVKREKWNLFQMDNFHAYFCLPAHFLYKTILIYIKMFIYKQKKAAQELL